MIFESCKARASTSKLALGLAGACSPIQSVSPQNQADVRTSLPDPHFSPALPQPPSVVDMGHVA